MSDSDPAESAVLRLGHIDYSNCLPVHARVLERQPRHWLEIRRGTPARLNAALRAGEIDVAPCSSIEYARAAQPYRILPGLAIAAEGEVGSIVLDSTLDLPRLDDQEIAVPDASATSVVLLRIVLERFVGVRPRYRWFSQERDRDPLETGAAAALYIGDVALRRKQARRERLDLGRFWRERTGLPFVFALWQTRLGAERDPDLVRLHAELLASLAEFEARRDALARAHAAAFGLEAAELANYWAGIKYRLDAPAVSGLRAFYRYALEMGEIPRIPPLRWTPGGQS